MLASYIFNKFKEFVPVPIEEIERWYPNTTDSIRVRLTSKLELIFTYENDDKWSLDTVERYLSNIFDKGVADGERIQG